MLNSEYRPFLGWIRKPIELTYINIKGKYQTRVSIGEKLNESIWFFGGSTMWGTGSKDSGTIPSLFYLKSKRNVFNFGVHAWTSRQSLNQLINLIGDNNVPDTIVFYDGINDVYYGCLTNHKSIPTHAQELKISKLIIRQNSVKNEINYIAEKFSNFIIEPYLRLIDKISYKKDSKKLSSNSPILNCHIDKNKANSVADHLVNNWYQAFLISKHNGYKFYSVLQPSIFDSTNDFDYLTSNDQFQLPIIQKQYEIVYPLIIEKIEEKCLDAPSFCDSFSDARNWIKSDSRVFIDHSHLTEEGNNIISEKLLTIIK